MLSLMNAKIESPVQQYEKQDTARTLAGMSIYCSPLRQGVG